MKTTPNHPGSLSRGILIALLSFFVAAGSLSAQTSPCNAHFNHGHGMGTAGEMFQAAPNPMGSTYAWDFGDGSTGNHQMESHVFQSPGSYWVCLTVTAFDPAGTTICTDTWCDSVHIGPAPTPVCDAHFMHHNQNGSSMVDFQAASVHPGNNVSWDFGDGTSGNQPNMTHNYSGPGTYYACLTVTAMDSTGAQLCTDTWCDSIHVGPPPPPVCNAHFTHNNPMGSAGTSFHPAPNPPGASFAWDFGDGNTANVISPNHVYTSPGVYYACLTVTNTDSAGTILCTDTWCDSIHVNGPHPVVCNAHFMPHQDPHSMNVFFSLGVGNFGPGTTVAWDYGDGTTGTTNQHMYAALGAYYVCLTITRTDTAGNVICSDNWCDSIHVHPFMPPHPHCNAHFQFFNMGNDSTFHFTAWGAVLTSFAWDFGDGTTSTDPAPNHTFPAQGAYFVCLTVTATDSAGAVICTDNWCDSVRTGFHPHPGHHHPPHHFSPVLSGNDVSGSGAEDRTDGIAETGQAVRVNIYPNPVLTQATLHLENTSGNISFRVIDGTGRNALYLHNLSNGDIQFNRNDWPAGLYFYQVSDDNGIYTGKILIQ